MLAVELLNRALTRHRAETTNETDTETGSVVRLAVIPDEARPPTEPTAEQRMWAYYVTEQAKGRTPTGAQLDLIAGTNNYGRKVLRRWRHTGFFRQRSGARGAAAAARCIGKTQRKRRQKEWFAQ